MFVKDEIGIVETTKRSPPGGMEQKCYQYYQVSRLIKRERILHQRQPMTRGPVGIPPNLKSLSRTLSVRLCIKLKCHISFHVLNDYAGNISVNHVWSVVGVFIVISDAVFTVTDTSTVIFQCHTNPSVSHGLGSVTVNE